VPSSSIERLLERLYPHHVMLGTEGQMAVNSALKVYLLVCSLNNEALFCIFTVRAMLALQALY